MHANLLQRTIRVLTEDTVALLVNKEYCIAREKNKTNAPSNLFRLHHVWCLAEVARCAFAKATSRG